MKYPYCVYPRGHVVIRVDEIFDGIVSTTGIGVNTERFEAKIAREYRKGDTADFKRIRYIQTLIDQDMFFMLSSGSTREELLARSRFVTDYMNSYPSWLNYISNLADKTGLHMVDIGDIYYRFMSLRFYKDDYKEVFESMLTQSGGVTIADAATYPIGVKEDQFRYGQVSLDMTNYNLAGFVMSCGLDLDDELAGLKTQTTFLSEKQTFTKLIRTTRRKVSNFLSLDEMYMSSVVDLPKFKLFDANVSELVLSCVYDLLSFQQIGDYIDSSRKKNWAVKAITAMMTLIELKNHFLNM